MEGGGWRATVNGVAKSQRGLSDLHVHFHLSPEAQELWEPGRGTLEAGWPEQPWRR